MRSCPMFFFSLMLLTGFIRGGDARSYKAEAGPHTVIKVRYEWFDLARKRQVPVKIYYPEEGEALPVVVFSHGLGGTREGYKYIGRHWAGHGYVSVHLQHLGSDDSVWRGAGDKAQLMQAMRKAAANPVNALHRPKDVGFALDEMLRLNAEASPFQGRLDLERIGVAGHSFGAWTTLIVAGELIVGPNGNEIMDLSDKRIKAAIPMSAPAPEHEAQRRAAFRRMRVPCLHMTGTEDTSPINDTTAAERRVPFDHARGADQYLLTFAGGDHMVFSGRLRRKRAGDDWMQSLILQTSTAFLDAYLREDAEALAWLREEFPDVLAGRGTFEIKSGDTEFAPREKKADDAVASEADDLAEELREALQGGSENERPEQEELAGELDAALE